MEKITWTNCQVRLGDLKKWEGNPAEIDKESAGRLFDSFNEFGQIMTLAIDPENCLVDGHQRLDVWQAKLGADFLADCRRASRMLTETERRKIAVYLRSGAVGRYSWDKLSAWDAVELQSWGFDNKTLRNWQNDATALKTFLEANEPEKPEDPGADIDRAEELREKWQTETGQLWIIPSKAGKPHTKCPRCGRVNG